MSDRRPRPDKRAYYAANAERERARARAWYAANKVRAQANMARRRAQVGPQPNVKKYGLTIEGYQELLDQQNGRCAICGTADNGKRRFLDVDHDHETGQVRGLLCNRCNRLLSNAADSIVLLDAATAYLRRARREARADESLDQDEALADLEHDRWTMAEALP